MITPIANVYGDIGYDTSEYLLHTALKAGVNYIDTAPWYGNGSSEETLGRALKSVPRDAYYVATKVGLYGNGVRPLKEQVDFSSEAVTK